MSGQRVRVAAAGEVEEGKLLGVRPDGQRVLLSRIRGRVYAAVDRCPHMGMPLAKGKLDGSVVTCPWHNSRFDLCSGRNMDWASAFLGIPMPGWTHSMLAMGKSPAPLKTLPVEESGGEVFVTV
jgi:nitrite reductase/ring-hydroxylating ferredoxin subunit